MIQIHNTPNQPKFTRFAKSSEFRFVCLYCTVFGYVYEYCNVVRYCNVKTNRLLV